jgi:hypothetical protein
MRKRKSENVRGKEKEEEKGKKSRIKETEKQWLMQQNPILFSHYWKTLNNLKN